MDNFLKYFFEDFGRVFRAFVEIFSALFNFLNYLLNFPMRMKIIDSYAEDFAAHLTRWIQVPSVKDEAVPGAPFAISSLPNQRLLKSKYFTCCSKRGIWLHTAEMSDQATRCAP